MAYNEIPFPTQEMLKAHVVSDFWGFRFHDKVTIWISNETKIAKANKDNQYVFGKTSRVYYYKFWGMD